MAKDKAIFSTLNECNTKKIFVGCNTLFPPACKYNWTGQELWQTHKCEYVM
jgi:hypothetical protein